MKHKHVKDRADKGNTVHQNSCIFNCNDFQAVYLHTEIEARRRIVTRGPEENRDTWSWRVRSKLHRAERDILDDALA